MGWVAPTERLSARRGSCILRLTPINLHPKWMQRIGDVRDFYDLLDQNREEARRVAERLYLAQRGYIQQRARGTFEYMRAFPNP